jgi:hypothetical protein
MRRIAAVAGTIAVVLILLVIGQLVLPGIAEQRLRDRLEKSGKVISVSVSAFPAIELLWHHADHVVIRMATYHSNPGHLSSLLDQAGQVDKIDASVNQLNTGNVVLHDARLIKRGNTLTGTATVSASDLQTAVPFVQNLTPVASSDGTLTFQGTVVGITADATLRAQNGILIVSPDVPLLNLVTVTVFSDPHIDVQGVGATGAPGGFSLSAQAQLR